jgi:hypothetical protein
MRGVHACTPPGAPLYGRSAAADELQDQHYQCDQKQYVDVGPQHMKADKTHQPQNQ